MPVIFKRHNYSVMSLNIIADMFHNIGVSFDNTAREIDNVFIIGEWLSSPFKFIADWFKYGESRAREANNFIKDIMEWTYTVIDGYGFNDLMDWSSTWLKWLRTDRRLFLLQIMGYYLREGYLFINNPNNWVYKMLIGYAFWLAEFITNPLLFIINRLTSRYYWFSGWLINPVPQIISWIISHNYLLRDFLNNPRLFIVKAIFYNYYYIEELFNNPTQFIINRIKSYSPFLASLITSRETFIYELVRRALGLPILFLTNPMLAIFDALLLLLEQRIIIIKDRLKTLLIRIILMFI